MAKMQMDYNLKKIGNVFTFNVSYQRKLAKTMVMVDLSSKIQSISSYLIVFSNVSISMTKALCLNLEKF